MKMLRSVSVGLLLVGSFAQVAATAPKPNVLFIAVDDLKPLLGCYGDTVIKSPNIDRLAARGMLFERAYCNQAVCAPSRNSLMTGVRPTTLGIYDLGTNFRQAAPDAVTMSQYFMKHGYRAEALGKIFHVGHGNHEDPASWSAPHWKANSIAYVLPESRAKEGLTREEALVEKIVIGEGEIDIMFSYLPTSEELCKNQQQLIALLASTHRTIHINCTHISANRRPRKPVSAMLNSIGQ